MFATQYKTQSWTRNVGCVCRVGRLPSMHPPWSIARSTSTAPGFIRRTTSSDTRTGARAPATSAAPTTRSASRPRVLDLVGVRRQRVNTPGAEGPVNLAQPVDPAVDHRDVGFHAHRDHASIRSGNAGSEYHHLRRWHSGYTAEQDAATTVDPLEARGTDLHGQPAGDLAHRREQRQRPVGELHGLVRDARDARGDDRVGDFA